MPSLNGEAKKIVRSHLVQLHDKGDYEGSLPYEAEQYEMDPDQVRAFRDGQDDALPAPAVATWARLIGADGVVTPGDIERDLYDWFGDHYGTEQTRVGRYDQYDIIEATRPEAESALSVWADMVCTGSVGDENRYSGGFEAHPVAPDETTRKLLSDIAYRVNQRLLPLPQKHMLVRDMAKYGDSFEQIGIGFDEDPKNPHVTELKSEAPRRMRVLLNGTPSEMYGWFPPTAQTPEATWPDWKIIHFANRKSRRDVYGRSIYQSILRSWVQVEAMESAIMIRRLERASQRYLYTIDTRGCSDDNSRASRINDARQRNKKVKTVDGNRNFQQQRISVPPGEDVYVGKSDKDSPSDVSVLEGDASLGEISDFKHFFNKMLAGMGPPKHHLGYEEDTMRSVGTELTMVFARKARRMQDNLIAGLNHLYWLEMLLRGIDPRTVKYVIFPPSLGTRDELIRAQIQVAHSTAVMQLAKAFAPTGKQPNTAWFLRYVMGLDDEAVASMELDNVIVKGGKSGGDKMPAGPNVSASEADAMLAKILENSTAAREIKFLRFLFQERHIAKMNAEQLYKISGGGDCAGSFDIRNAVRQLKIGRAA